MMAMTIAAANQRMYKSQRSAPPPPKPEPQQAVAAGAKPTLIRICSDKADAETQK